MLAPHYKQALDAKAIYHDGYRPALFNESLCTNVHKANNLWKTDWIAVTVSKGFRLFLLRESLMDTRVSPPYDGMANSSDLISLKVPIKKPNTGFERSQLRGMARSQTLSPQQERVLALVADGRTNKEIAAALGLSDKTVKNYLNLIFRKLKVGRRARAAVIYRQIHPE